MSAVVLAFFSSVLLNVIDAVFLCYALDLDTQSVTKQEVHEVFSQVSLSFTEKPDHSLMPNIMTCVTVYALCVALPILRAYMWWVCMCPEAGMRHGQTNGVQVPVGVAVEQPGGDYAYGAPASPVRGPAYVPPSHPAAAAGHSPTAHRPHDSSAQV